MAAWKSDIQNIQGFSEDINGWGHEDADFVFRLHLSGVMRRSGSWSTEVLHLYHSETNKSKDKLNADILKNFIKNRINSSLVQIGYRKAFDDIDTEILSQTEWFDDDVLGNTSTDFFYARPVNYVKGNKTYNEEDLF